MQNCDWCNLSEKDRKWLLIENASWTVYLADRQDYPGRCILILKRHCTCLSDLTTAEWADLKPLVDRLEHCFKETLVAEMCNWSCLLNDAYKNNSPCPHLHLHVRPRYKNPLYLNGKIFYDKEFGHHYDIHKETCISQAEETYRILYDLLKKALSSL